MLSLSKLKFMSLPKKGYYETAVSMCTPRITYILSENNFLGPWTLSKNRINSRLSILESFTLDDALKRLS